MIRGEVPAKENQQSEKDQKCISGIHLDFGLRIADCGLAASVIIVTLLS
jgi:hypothetical protein